VSALFSNAQKKIEKILVLDEQITTVVFDMEHVFLINLMSTKRQNITYKAISEGEYANYFVITETVTNNMMTVSGRIAFTFPNNQDKLSAHKVHAIAIEITVPENLEIVVNSDIGNLDAEGYYKLLTTNFMSGNCVLHRVSGNLIIHTVDGNINLTTNKGQVIPETKTGVITQEQLVKGNSVFKLKTIKGDINIENSK
jgi:hypothetical protein